MRNGSRSFSGRSWKPTTLVLTLLTLLSPHIMAVEPTIQAKGNVSLFLRNDGVLFQLGGQPFAPVTLPDTAISPIQPKAAILTHVDSLPILKSQDESYEGSFKNGMALAIASPTGVELGLFAWKPGSSDEAQPTRVSELSQIKEIFLGASCYYCPPYFVVTDTGTVFSLDEDHNAKQLSGLSDVKLITADSSRYVALTNAGTVFYGHWDSSSRQYEPAIPIADLTNVKDLKYREYINKDLTHHVSYALVNDKVYGWTWEHDRKTSTDIPTTITPVMDETGNELSQVTELRWRNQTLAVTQTGTVYWWGWNGDNKIPTIALPITDLPDVVEVVGRYSSYLARTLTGEIYYWTWKTSSNSPTSASQITLPSAVETLFIPKDSSSVFAILNNGEVYRWYWDSSSGSPSSPTQMSELSNLEEIQSYLGLDLPNVKTIAKENHTLVLQEDGTLCGAGRNYESQLGINAPNYISSDNPLCGIEYLLVGPSTVFTPLTVTKTGTGEGTITADTGTIYCGDSCQANYHQGQTVTLRTKPQIGSTFTSWSGDCTDTEPETQVTLTNAATCTATFDKVPPRKLTVIKAGKGNGTVTSESEPASTGGDLDCGSTCTVDYPNRTEVTLTTTPDANSEVAEVNCYREFILTEDRECTVTFEPLASEYPLKVVVNHEDGNTGKVVSEPAGIDCDGECTHIFPRGTEVNLTLIPNPGSTIKQWYCSSRFWSKSSSRYNPASSISVKVGRPSSCSITFGLPLPPPKIEVAPPSHQFEFKGTGIENRLTQDFSISNASETRSDIDSITVKGASDFRALEDNCSGKYLGFNDSCEINVAYEPHTDATQTATLWIDSDEDPNAPLTIPFCAGAYSSTLQEQEVYPSALDFGVKRVGNSMTLTQWVKTWADGCGALIDQNRFTLDGKDATNFDITLKECYYAAWDDKTDNPNKTTYSTCQININFLPTAPEGVKNAQLNYALDDISLPTSPIPLSGIAVAASSAQPKPEASPSSLDFGEIILYRSSPQSPLTIKNAGNINLNPSAKLIGLDAADFSIIGGECSTQDVLFPGQSCDLSLQFTPQGTSGNKQASLIIAPEKPYATTVALTGNSIEGTTDCADANITIETSGRDNHWNVDLAWNRLRSPAGFAEVIRPTKNDVVRIKSGHTLLGPISSDAVVKTLCIENGATLQSLDDQGTSLAIRATHFIGNWGSIRGQEGANEEPTATSCTTKAAVGTGSCAKPGANVILKVGSSDSGGPLVNEGLIKAGKGGSGSQYAAVGGDVSVYARNILNKKAIQAGNGGDILGPLEGESGAGGFAQVRGNFGGQGYLRSEIGTQIIAGDGGKCSYNVTEPQMGGKGGNLSLMTVPDLYLGGGNHRAGKGDRNCAKNRGDGKGDGQVRIEPNVISLAGANTKVEGGDIFIYGGPNWTLDLSNLTGRVVTATGDITLAVGEGGVIDLRGSSGELFNAVGQVNFFSDKIRLDEKQKLSSLIEASQIVIGPHKILRDVALTGATQIVGGPDTTTSLTLSLANGSPVNDTFSLTMTDPGGWISNPLPDTLEVASLDVVELTLEVMLPAQVGITDTIMVTATSQADPMVTATINIQVKVVDPKRLVPDPPTLSPSLPWFTVESVSVGTECPTDGTINFFCSNHGQILKDVTVTSSASIVGGSLAGTLTNQGYVSQVTIQAGATLIGGKLTGYIMNEGTLADFEFVGTVIEGGTLAGIVTNRSQNRGTIKNVNLAANTTISGVNLQGNIVGDNSAPALLENVTIKANSVLSGVKLGKDVIVEDNVTCGEAVQAPEGVCSPDQTEPLPKPKLPDLGVTAINKQGESVPSNAAFYGGISVNNQAAKAQATSTLADEVTIQGQIQIDPDHISQTGDVVVYVSYQPLAADADEPLAYFMLDEEGQMVDYDNEPAHLVSSQIIQKLDKPIEVLMYQGKLPATGMLNIEFGYRLPDGLVVHNFKPIEVNVNK